MNAAARQVGAVIGTAILVAFVGTATDYPSAMRAFDDSYLVAAIGVVLSGVSVLTLPRATHHGPRSVDPRRPEGAAARAVAAGRRPAATPDRAHVESGAAR